MPQGELPDVQEVINIVTNKSSPSVVPDQRGPAKAKIDTMIDNTIGKTNTIISDIVGGVFGRQGYSQDNIPDPMRRGGVDSKCENSHNRRQFADFIYRPCCPGTRLGHLA